MGIVANALLLRVSEQELQVTSNSMLQEYKAPLNKTFNSVFRDTIILKVKYCL